MRIILITLLLFSSTGIFAQPGVAPEREVEGKRYYVHKVEAGNTLWGLQQMYGVKADLIMSTNPELSSGLKVGQSILIPIEKSAAAPVQAVTSEYKVKRGETLYGLSRKFNTTVDEIIRLNPILTESTLQKGQTITVPGLVESEGDTDPVEVLDPEVSPVPNPFVVDTVETVEGTSQEVRVNFSDSIVMHKVLPHETMYSISKRFMVPIETIIKENKLSSTSLSQGQVLKIRVKQERIEKLEIKPVPEVYNPKGTDPIEFEVKDRYKVAVILPFFLQHSKGYSEYVSDVSAQFYMGSILALDTLKAMGLNADVQYYDSRRDSAAIMEILNNPDFKNTDLVIGPLFPNTQKLVAKYCNDNAIRMITPVTAETSILEGNRVVYSAVPSAITLMNGLGKYVASNHKTNRIILVKPTKEEDMPLYEAFRDSYNRAEVTGSKAALNETTMEGMKNLMTKSSDNIFIMPTNSRYNAAKFISEVSRSDFRAKKGGIVIYGTKDWVEYTDIHNAYKNEYNFRFAGPNFIDYFSPEMIEMNKLYRKMYSTDMAKMAVQGYDIMLYACSAFFLDGKPVNLLMNAFELEQVSEGDGFENQHFFIVEQEDFELINADAPKK